MPRFCEFAQSLASVLAQCNWPHRGRFKSARLACAWVSGYLLSLLAQPPALGASSAPGAEVHFYPSRSLRCYEVDARHGLSGALLQNAALLNGTDSVLTFERADCELLSGGVVVQVHHLTTADLERAIQRGLMLQKAGLLEKFAFQFRTDVLLGKETALATGLAVLPKAAILLGQHYFVFGGVVDELRLRGFARRPDGTMIEMEGTLPVKMKASEGDYSFPLAGRWFIGVGQGLYNPHRWVVPEEFALDIVKLGNNASTHQGTGAKRSDYYAYGEPVLAAADGAVTAVEESLTEADSNLQQAGEAAEAYQARLLAMQDALLAQGTLRTAGNYIVLRHAGGEYSFYAHLLPGSLRVRPGERVKKGQPIARLGNSGNSTEPHLHFGVLDGPDPLLSAAVPIRFQNIVLPFAGEVRALHDGDIVDTK